MWRLVKYVNGAELISVAWFSMQEQYRAFESLRLQIGGLLSWSDTKNHHALLFLHLILITRKPLHCRNNHVCNTVSTKAVAAQQQPPTSRVPRGAGSRRYPGRHRRYHEDCAERWFLCLLTIGIHHHLRVSQVNPVFDILLPRVQ